MRLSLKLASVAALVLAAASTPTATRLVPTAAAPPMTSVGPLLFGSSGVLFAADPLAATVYALDLGTQASSGKPGTAPVANLDQKIAGLVGTTPAEISITDLAVHPVSHNSFVAVMRGQGANARPALIKIDGAGEVTLVSLDNVKYTSVTLPNPAAVSPNGRGGRTQSVTDMALMDGRLYVAGLSNEEFASKLWSVAYPFAAPDNGTSVEIYHSSHGQFETRAPIMTFLPYKIGNDSDILAAYTCTPLVKFPLNTLKTGQKVTGSTIIDLGAGNQPLDMITYAKGGQSYLLLANSRYGIVKVPTAQLASLPSITTQMDKAGSFEAVPSMTNVEQLALLDATHAATITHEQNGPRDLTTPDLP